MKPRIAILGANGFSGKHFVKYLSQTGLDQQYEPLLIDISSVDSPYLSYKIDVTDPVLLTNLLEELSPSLIINLMGVLRGNNLDHFYQCNVRVSQTLMEYAAQRTEEISKILLIGSAAEYGYVQSNPVDENYPRHPISPYGLSKVLQQEVAQYFFLKNSVPVVIARTFNLTGEGISPQLAIGAWRDKISSTRNGGTIKVGNIDSYRDYIDIDYVVDVYWKLLQQAPIGEVFNVCSGSAIQMRELLQNEINISGKNITVEIDKSLYKTDDLPIIFGDNTKLNNFLSKL